MACDVSVSTVTHSLVTRELRSWLMCSRTTSGSRVMWHCFGFCVTSHKGVGRESFWVGLAALGHLGVNGRKTKLKADRLWCGVLFDS